MVLLLIAMPLKYYFAQPGFVKVVGWIHGILFIAYVIAVFTSVQAMRWNWFSVMVALVASLLPFGTFVLDKKLKIRQQELSVKLQKFSGSIKNKG